MERFARLSDASWRGGDDFNEQIASMLCAMDIEPPDGAPATRRQVTAVSLRSVTVVKYEAQGQYRGCRRWDHIRSDSVDCYVIQLPDTASFRIGQGDHVTTVLPGSFAVMPTARPFQVLEASMEASRDPFASTHVRVPGALLRSLVPQVDNICNTPFAITRGVGRIMQRVVESALEDGPALSAAHAARFGDEVLETVVRSMEWAVDLSGHTTTPRRGSLERIHEQATAFIEARLSSEALNTQHIADHCHVSLRYLHAAFQNANETVAASIRERRLQRCRQILCNPMSRHRSILQIATDWGFCDAAYFSHIYKARFGVRPSDERRLASID